MEWINVNVRWRQVQRAEHEWEGLPVKGRSMFDQPDSLMFAAAQLDLEWSYQAGHQQ